MQEEPSRLALSTEQLFSPVGLYQKATRLPSEQPPHPYQQLPLIVSSSLEDVACFGRFVLCRYTSFAFLAKAIFFLTRANR
ncbi:unnamed protein product, partial [Nesidiocoris tenuis]